MVWVAFESVELDAVQLLETLPAALAREIVLHLCCVLLHVPVERSTLPALVAADLAPARSQGTVREGRASPRKGWRHLGLECRWNLVWQPQDELACGTCSVLVQARISSLLVPSRDACHSLQGCLASVCAPVYFQVVLPFERFATGLTGEFPDT